MKGPLLVVCAAVLLFLKYASAASIPNVRPPSENRTYVSPGIDRLIDDLAPLWVSADLATLFSNALPNTLDTTVFYHSDQKPDSFIITGDIQAMWLRDSTNQVLPYVPYASSDPKLRSLLLGLIARQAKSISLDSFANAFNFDSTGAWNTPGSGDSNDHQNDVRTPPMSPGVFEGKYEIDSISAFLKLSYYYFTLTGDASFAAPAAAAAAAGTAAATAARNTNGTAASPWLAAVSQVVNTMAKMQHVGQDPHDQPYTFQRETSVATDTLEMSGRGPPGCSGVGLSRSLFRPSDDAVSLPYNIPGNAMACVELRHLLELLNNKDVASASAAASASGNTTKDLIERTDAVMSGICGALDSLQAEVRSEQEFLGQKSPPSPSPLPKRVGTFPYEVDGFGSKLYMDDANTPSLLSLPLLGYHSELYAKTREYVLSAENPFFFEGTAGAGIGGPHVGYQMAWPMAITVQALTSTDDAEISKCLNMLVRAASSTGLMHESFNVNNVDDFTRTWFAWANGLFGELLLQLAQTRPHLVLVNDAAVFEKAQAIVRPTVTMLAMREAEKKQK